MVNSQNHMKVSNSIVPRECTTLMYAFMHVQKKKSQGADIKLLIV